MSKAKSYDFLNDRLNMNRRTFLQSTAAGAAALGAGGLIKTRDAEAFAFEPYPRDDQLTTVVTSCAHNCGSRHMLVAHKKGDVIVRISTDDGRYQREGFFGKDTEEEPQVRGCLRGRSYRQRLYATEFVEQFTREENAHDSIRETAEADLDVLFGVIDEGIEGKSTFLRRGFSALDIYLAMIARWHPDRDALFARYTKVAAVCEQTENRPACRAVMEEHFEQ